MILHDELFIEWWGKNNEKFNSLDIVYCWNRGLDFRHVLFYQSVLAILAAIFHDGLETTPFWSKDISLGLPFRAIDSIHNWIRLV